MKKFAVYFLAVAFTIGSLNISYAAKSISDLKKQQTDIQNQKKNTQNSLNTVKQNKSQALQEVEKLDSQLNVVENELERLRNELEDTKKRLAEGEVELENATEDKENQYVQLKKRLRVMYENGTIGYLQIILEAQDFTDFLKRVEYINRLSSYDKELLQKYEKIEKTIAEKVKQIEEDKANIEVLSKQQEDKKKVLDESIKVKEELVKKLNQEETSYLQQIADLEAADKDVKALISEAQAKAAAEAKAKAAAAAKSGNTGGSSSAPKYYSYTGGTLQYPVPAYSGYKPNSPYGYRSSPISGKSEFHTGVDLKATMGTDVVAAEAGTIIFSGPKGGYGNCVIIDHGGGMSTLYAHNSRLCVSVGDSVKRGQVVSKAGTTGYSTGVHLHFEVRIGGSHTDPMPYLRG